MRRTAVLLACLSACSCQSKSAPSPEKEPAQQVEPSAAAESFGAPLQNLSEVPLGEVIAAPDKFADKAIRVSGTARRVCQNKGCWMELAAGDAADAPACRVKFKDYGFFVPKDSAGARATLEGTVKVKRVRPGRVRHLEAEGAEFASKNEDGSANEVQFVADGVELVR